MSASPTGKCAGPGPFGRLRRDSEDEGNDAPPAIRARFERPKQYFLAAEPLSEPVPRAEVEIGIARRRARRIDAGDFEPDAVFESQFEPFVDRDDPAAGAALARAKPVRRSQAARGHKRNHGPGEKNGEAHARPGAKVDLRAREAAPRPAPKRANLPPLSSARGVQ